MCPTVSTLESGCPLLPKPGMLFPCAVGSRVRQVLLAEEHVQTVAVAEGVAHVHRPAIDVDDGRGGTDEPRGSRGGGDVGTRDERQQLPNHRVRHARALFVAQHEAVEIHALPLADAVVGGEVERPPAPDRTAERPAELVALERVWLRRGELEEVSRVEGVIPEVLEGVAANPVRARTRHDVHDRAGDVAVLGRKDRRVRLELVQAADRRLENQRPEGEVVRRDAVDDERDRFFAVTGGVERERAEAADGPR